MTTPTPEASLLPPDHDQAIAEVGAIIRYLLRNPDLYGTILWCARAEQAARDGIRFSADDPEGPAARTLDAARSHASRWMAAAKLNPCSDCFAPVIHLPAEWALLDWPDLRRHECSALPADVLAPPPPVSRPPRRPPPSPPPERKARVPQSPSRRLPPAALRRGKGQ